MLRLGERTAFLRLLSRLKSTHAGVDRRKANVQALNRQVHFSLFLSQTQFRRIGPSAIPCNPTSDHIQLEGFRNHLHGWIKSCSGKGVYLHTCVTSGSSTPQLCQIGCREIGRKCVRPPHRMRDGWSSRLVTYTYGSYTTSIDYWQE